jgi:hypothetical protein
MRAQRVANELRLQHLAVSVQGGARLRCNLETAPSGCSGSRPVACYARRSMDQSSRWSMILIGLLAQAVFLTISVLGWGDWRSFFADPPRLAMILLSLVLTVVALASGVNVQHRPPRRPTGSVDLRAVGDRQCAAVLAAPVCRPTRPADLRRRRGPLYRLGAPGRRRRAPRGTHPRLGQALQRVRLSSSTEASPQIARGVRLTEVQLGGLRRSLVKQRRWSRLSRTRSPPSPSAAPP